MAVPNPKTWAAGELVDGPEGNAEWRDVFNFLLGPPRCYAYKSVDESLSNNTWEALNFESELYDSHGGHSTSTNTARLTAPESGLYTVVCQVRFQSNGTGARQIQVRKNDSTTNATGGTRLALISIPATTGGDVTVVGHTIDTQLNVTDWIVLDALQNSGGALDAQGGSGETFMSFRWVAKTST